MFANKNNLRSELTANIGVLDTSISITSGEGILWENDMVACLEHYENDVCTKREIIKITAKNNDTFTVTRGFAVCIMNDATKQQGQGSQTFSVGDFLSLYLSKELRESITQNIGINETALQTMIGHITAPRTCINNNCLSWKQSIDSAYNTKYGGIAGFGDASDGDCVITTNDLDDHGYFYFDASREYNFNNLTICEGVVVRFEGSGVPRINVRNNFKNFGCIELKAPFVSNDTMTDCRLEKGCEICNQKTNRDVCDGGNGGNGANNGCKGCPASDSSTGGYGGQGGASTGYYVCPGGAGGSPDGCNGGNGGGGGGRSSSCSNSGGGGGGGGGGSGRYGNGGNGGNGGSGTYSRGDGGKGGNSGLRGKGGQGGEAGNDNYGGSQGMADSGDGFYGGTGRDQSYSTQDAVGQGGNGGKGIYCGGDGGYSRYGVPGKGGDAITNVYGFHLNARNIWNNYVDASGGNGGNAGNTFNCTNYTNSGGNGANGGQMIISYDCMFEQGCFDVSGGKGGCGSHNTRTGTNGTAGTDGTDGRVVFHSVNYPYISNFNLENDDDNESILITWKDPMLKQSAPNQWKNTMIRVSTTNYPATITDGTLVVNETTKNQYESTPFSMSATDGVTYYFTAFAIAQDDTMIDVQTNSITAEFLVPSEYQAVEYIQSTGTQWINTNIFAYNKYKVETKIERTTTDQDTPLFGCWYASNYDNIRKYYHLTPYSNKWCFGINGTESFGGTYTDPVGTQYIVSFNDENNNIVINNSIIANVSGVVGANNTKLAISYRGAPNHYRYGKFKYFYFKIYDKIEGKYICELIPCYRKSDSVIGMWDRVNKVFYTNAGSGTFLKGGNIN